MARSVEEINSYIVDNVVSQFASIGMTIDPTLWSKRNLLRLICYTVAIAQALMEQLQDAFISDVEAVVDVASAASFAWIQAKMFEFQYSSTNPQFVTLVNTVPMYPIVDPTLRIITACSVTSDLSNVVTIKLAKSSPFQALSNLELSSTQGYIDTIGDAGIDYFCVSLNPDQLYVSADIYFQGQYASVIQSIVIAAITDWLASLAITNFDGKIKMSDLEEEIRNIPGVNDVVLKGVRGRADAVSFSAGVDLIVGTQILQREYSTNAGYIIPETTVTKTLADTLNFITD